MSKKPSAPHYDFDSESIPYASVVIEPESPPLPAKPLDQPAAQPLHPKPEQQLVQPPVQPLGQLQPPVSPLPDRESNEPFHQQQEQRDGQPKVGEWGAELTGWWDNCVPNCLCSTFCPWFSLAQITRRLGWRIYYWGLAVMLLLWVGALTLLALGAEAPRRCETKYSYYSERFVTSCYRDYDRQTMYLGGAAALYFALLMCIWRLRIRVRQKFDIPGQIVGDLLTALMCPFCTVAQMATHVHSYEQHALCSSEPDTLPGYNAA